MTPDFLIYTPDWEKFSNLSSMNEVENEPIRSTGLPSPNSFLISGISLPKAVVVKAAFII